MRIFEIFDFERLTIPVDKSCHSGLTCRSTRHEIITRYRGVILSRITYRKIDSNACEKKEEVVFVFICNGKAEEAERLV